MGDVVNEVRGLVLPQEGWKEVETRAEALGIDVGHFLELGAMLMVSLSDNPDLLRLILKCASCGDEECRMKEPLTGSHS